MNKCINFILAVLLFSSFATASYADKLGNPITGITQDTGYLLNKDEWQYEVSNGFVSGGLTDFLTFGLNVYYELLAPNLNGKIRLINESNNFPQIALGASSSYNYQDYTLYFSKALSEKWLYGSLKYLSSKYYYNFEAANYSRMFLCPPSINTANATMGMIIKNAEGLNTILEISLDNSLDKTVPYSRIRGGACLEVTLSNARCRIMEYANGESLRTLFDLTFTGYASK